MWVNHKMFLFGGILDLATAFFQNMLGNVITINNLYVSITNDQKAGNLPLLYYDLARLLRIIIDFQPV
jgi:hypothetical protein